VINGTVYFIFLGAVVKLIKYRLRSRYSAAKLTVRDLVIRIRFEPIAARLYRIQIWRESRSRIPDIDQGLQKSTYRRYRVACILSHTPWKSVGCSMIWTSVLRSWHSLILTKPRSRLHSHPVLIALRPIYLATKSSTPRLD
jgi:hypothetical protein